MWLDGLGALRPDVGRLAASTDEPLTAAIALDLLIGLLCGGIGQTTLPPACCLAENGGRWVGGSTGGSDVNRTLPASLAATGAAALLYHIPAANAGSFAQLVQQVATETLGFSFARLSPTLDHCMAPNEAQAPALEPRTAWPTEDIVQSSSTLARLLACDGAKGFSEAFDPEVLALRLGLTPGPAGRPIFRLDTDRAAALAAEQSSAAAATLPLTSSNATGFALNAPPPVPPKAHPDCERVLPIMLDLATRMPVPARGLDTRGVPLFLRAGCGCHVPGRCADGRCAPPVRVVLVERAADLPAALQQDILAALRPLVAPRAADPCPRCQPACRAPLSGPENVFTLFVLVDPLPLTAEEDLAPQEDEGSGSRLGSAGSCTSGPEQPASPPDSPATTPGDWWDDDSGFGGAGAVALPRRYDRRRECSALAPAPMSEMAEYFASTGGGRRPAACPTRWLDLQPSFLPVFPSLGHSGPGAARQTPPDPTRPPGQLYHFPLISEHLMTQSGSLHPAAAAALSPGRASRPPPSDGRPALSCRDLVRLSWGVHCTPVDEKLLSFARGIVAALRDDAMWRFAPGPDAVEAAIAVARTLAFLQGSPYTTADHMLAALRRVLPHRGELLRPLRDADLSSTTAGFIRFYSALVGATAHPGAGNSSLASVGRYGSAAYHMHHHHHHHLSYHHMHTHGPGTPPPVPGGLAFDSSYCPPSATEQIHANLMHPVGSAFLQSIAGIGYCICHSPHHWRQRAVATAQALHAAAAVPHPAGTSLCIDCGLVLPGQHAASLGRRASASSPPPPPGPPPSPPAPVQTAGRERLDDIFHRTRRIAALCAAHPLPL
ncbi:hypothetical protein H696_05097 [Fonticula alba]|uniref:Uncharacterized protein n=1 Tax=Fonticula alba TaxID=691883 RepID=A0A058Z1K8_FONAL|nr:hypothetical protein H696_05097 [Fonticula alba]KCV68169.1 hypothetical protein H696_05097 [Fonticula alba]|eukprot:XP_009497223.1 hypothetical protein H696_05097 [Fonticula alba]